MKEPDFDAMIKGKKGGWLPPRFMSINTAVAQLLEAKPILLRVLFCARRATQWRCDRLD